MQPVKVTIEPNGNKWRWTIRTRADDREHWREPYAYDHLTGWDGHTRTERRARRKVRRALRALGAAWMVDAFDRGYGRQSAAEVTIHG